MALAYLRKILEANLETVLAAFVLFYFILFFNENLSLKLKNNASGKIWTKQQPNEYPRDQGNDNSWLIKGDTRVKKMLGIFSITMQATLH